MKTRKNPLDSLEEPHIVATYHYGSTVCHIADNCIAKTPEERERVMDDIRRVGWGIVINARKNGVDI